MKKSKIYLIAILYMFSFYIKAGTMTGFAASIINYENILDFSGENYEIKKAGHIFSELNLKLVNVSEKRIELNIIFNYTKGRGVTSETGLVDFSQVGVGLEFGKILRLLDFKLSGKIVSIDFIPGLSGLISFKRKIEYNEINDQFEPDEKKLFYNFGFYTTFRLTMHFKRADIFTGFQISLPFYSNDIPLFTGQSLIRSKFLIGAAF